MDYNIIELTAMRKAKENQINLQRLCNHITGLTETAVEYTKNNNVEVAKTLYLRISVLELFVREFLLKDVK